MQAEIELKIGGRCEAYPMSPDVRSVVFVGDVEFDKKRGKLKFTATGGSTPGPKGDKGDRGDPGQDGAPGPQGDPGEPGESLTLADVIDVLYPVGALYTSTIDTNPATLLGRGTWAAFGSGKVMVGHNASDSDFDTSEKTGGAKTVAASGAVSAPSFSGTQASLTHSGTAVNAHSGAAVADHASHTHTYTQVPNHVHVQRLQGGTTGTTTGTHLMGSAATGGSLRSSAQSTLDPTGGVASATTNGPSATLTHSVTQPADHSVTQPSAHSYTPQGTVGQPSFTGSATSVVQPYIVVYAWKRTA